MEFGTRKKNVIGTGSRISLGDPSIKRPSQLTTYETPPEDAISLDDFELHAVERLRVLLASENATSRGDNPTEVYRKLEDSIKTTHLELRTEEDFRNDNISHWVLRLAFAATEDLRRRFLAFETLLFKYRFEKKMDSQSVQRFMNENNMEYRPISNEEREMHKDGLRNVFTATTGWRANAGITSRGFENLKFFKVGFEEVTDLVTKRQVYLYKGFAFVPETDLLSILSSRYRQNLSFQIINAFKTLPLVKEDDRVRPILAKLENAYLGPEFGTRSHLDGSGCVRDAHPDNIDTLSRSFPMCMRELHGALQRDHHLRYHGRNQFQLFLKAIGLSMKDALTYFSREFCKKGMSPDEFNKKYAYNIRHAYGQEGKRANYSAYNCMQIIMGVQPGSGEYHGCPFKSMGAPQMNKLLTRQFGTSQQNAINEICNKMASKDFQIACRLHFELEHQGADSGVVGNHPNAWYEQSLKYFEARTESDEPSQVK